MDIKFEPFVGDCAKIANDERERIAEFLLGLIACVNRAMAAIEGNHANQVEVIPAYLEGQAQANTR